MASPRGRRPLPTKLKILNGNAGKRPLNKNEPAPAVEIPDCPEHLSAIARKEWERVVEQLGTLDLLTTLDRSALAAYCDTYDRWVQATQAIQKSGLVLRMGTTIIQSPYVEIANKSIAQMRVLLTEFGMTPSSRSRISSMKHQEDGDPNFGDGAVRPRGR